MHIILSSHIMGIETMLHKAMKSKRTRSNFKKSTKKEKKKTIAREIV